MRFAQLATAVLAAGVAAACAKPSPTHTASREECEQYRDKLFSLLPDAEREAGTRMGMHKATKYELDLCVQRVTSAEVTCAAKTTTLADALACKPTVDIRPPEAKRTPEECVAFTTHVMKLAEVFDKNEGIGPPFTPSMATMFARECERWMTKERYDCVLKAGMPMDLMRCKP